jgi:hypothetical protein
MRIKKSKERNTFEGLRYCSNSCEEKTEGESIVRLFISIKISEELNRKLFDI